MSDTNDRKKMQESLEKLGLSENETKVYLAVLGLGPSPAVVIANQAQVKRSTTYLVLQHLISMGLVSEVADSKEKMFKAEDPDRLTKLTRKMRRRVVDAEIELEKLLPGLKAIQKKIIESPKLNFYQGLEGIKTITEEASAYPEPWYYFGPVGEWMKSLSQTGFEELVLDTREYRHKVGRPTCFMITDSDYYKIKLFQKFEPQIRQARILSSLSKSKSGFAIYGKKLALISLGDMPFGAVIESAEVVDLVKMMFLFIWQSLPEEKASKGK